MNYQKIYENLMEHRKQNIPSGYGEHHHIIPRSIGGTDITDNIVKLTAREHFFAHTLLARFTIGKQKRSMWNAVFRMSTGKSKEKYKITSRRYEVIRQHYSDTHWTKDKEKMNGVVENRMNGEYKYDYSWMSQFMKNWWSTMDEQEYKDFCVARAAKTDWAAKGKQHSEYLMNLPKEERCPWFRILETEINDLRIKEMRKTKSSLIKAILPSGEEIIFWTYEDEIWAKLGISSKNVKYTIESSVRNGLCPTSKIKFEYLYKWIPGTKRLENMDTMINKGTK